MQLTNASNLHCECIDFFRSKEFSWILVEVDCRAISVQSLLQVETEMGFAALKIRGRYHAGERVIYRQKSAVDARKI